MLYNYEEEVIEDVSIDEDSVQYYDIKEDIRFFFNDKNILQKAKEYTGRSFEHRPQQVEMGYCIADSLCQKKNACIEAPTGIGKSLAYLVPSIHYAINNKKTVLVTTETIHLQEQLIKKDLPLLKNIMGVNFTAILAKGRSNYLCLRRLNIIRDDNTLLAGNFDILNLAKIENWVENTDDGTRSDLSFNVESSLWSNISCEMGNCNYPKCPFSKNCFYWLARKKWDHADIIVANHALFFTDLKIRMIEGLGGSILPNYDALIVDEAHTIEDDAAQHLGLRISNSSATFLLNRLFNPDKQQGLMMSAGSSSFALREVVTNLHSKVQSFFETINQFMLNKDDKVVRLHEPHCVSDILSEPFRELQNLLIVYSKTLDKEDNMKIELDAQIARCELFIEGIFEFLNMTKEGAVYWIEKEYRNRYEDIVLYSAPLNVNTILNEILFQKDFPVILTSATLAVNNDLSYYQSRIGITNHYNLILSSPFDFYNQVKLYIANDMPEPNESNYKDEILKHIKHCISITHGKAFVLFTSYQLLKYCSEHLESFFQKENLNLFVQGTMGRSMMLDEFRKDINSVIFGTTSFWTGVDVPGEALSNVIITKLPFSVPSHPLIQARTEVIDKNGGRGAFMEYALPEAVLKFKQGIGRLIRRKDDNGIIAILDKRVISKGYGSFFLNSIPNCPRDIY